MELFAELLREFWNVLRDMAPFLLLGFFLAGVFHVLVPTDWVVRQLGGRGLWPIVKAALIGIPVPLCSCGILPVAASLRKAGASKGSTASFLISGPETDIDNIVITWGVMGPLFSVYRVVVSMVNSIGAGWLIERFGGRDPEIPPAAAQQSCCDTEHQHAHACCSGGLQAAEPHASCSGGFPAADQQAATCSCATSGGSVALTMKPRRLPSALRVAAASSSRDGSDSETLVEQRRLAADPATGKPPLQGSGQSGWMGKAWDILRGSSRYAFVTLPRDLGTALLVGLLIAAVLTLVGQWLLPYLRGTDPVVGILGAMLLGLPMYVCSTSSIPIAASLVYNAGLTPGAALAFMIAGPATNAAAVALLWKLLGPRSTMIYLGSIAVTAFSAGVLLDKVFMPPGHAFCSSCALPLPPLMLDILGIAMLAVLSAPLIQRVAHTAAQRRGISTQRPQSAQ